MTQSTSVITPGRRERKQAETRRRLIEAARDQISEGGPESVTITSITDRADVAQGTFYNYFESRDAIIDALIFDSVESLGQRLDALTAGMSDAAHIYSFSLRHLMNTALSDPAWGWVMIRLGITHETLLKTLGPRAARDLQIGVESGRFTIPDVSLAAAMTFGGLISAMHEYLGGEDRDAPSTHYAEYLLRMAGIPAAEAHDIVRLPLPPLPQLTER